MFLASHFKKSVGSVYSERNKRAKYGYDPGTVWCKVKYPAFSSFTSQEETFYRPHLTFLFTHFILLFCMTLVNTLRINY